MAKKPKKQKKKDKSAATAKQEIDAVKGFIFVMILLIVALGVFIVITNNRLTRYDDSLAAIKQSTRPMGLRALEVEQYLKMIDNKDEEIKRITGVAVGEAAAEAETTTGAVVHAFTTGTMVQVFQLGGRISADAWNGNGSSDQSITTEDLPC